MLAPFDPRNKDLGQLEETKLSNRILLTVIVLEFVLIYIICN